MEVWRRKSGRLVMEVLQQGMERKKVVEKVKGRNNCSSYKEREGQR